MVKLAPRGHMVSKMVSNTPYFQNNDLITAGPSSAADPRDGGFISSNGEDEGGNKDSQDINIQQKSRNLFADATVPSFFRWVVLQTNCHKSSPITIVYTELIYA